MGEEFWYKRIRGHGEKGYYRRNQDAEEQAIESHGWALLDRSLNNLDSLSSDITSPIERLFFLALVARSDSHPYINYVCIRPSNSTNPTEWLYHGDKTGRQILIIEPQKRILEYKVDFYLSYFDDNQLANLIIECDGHEWHEKTKEQAAKDKARDRHLQILAPIFHYTGQEIVKEPFVVVDEIIEELGDLSVPNYSKVIFEYDDTQIRKQLNIRMEYMTRRIVEQRKGDG